MLSLLLTACTSTGSFARIEPTSVQVEVQGELGSPEAPLEFPRLPISRTVSLQTLDRDGQPYDFNGDLSLRVRPGTLGQSSWVTVEGGQWTGEILFKGSYGPTRVWASDEGDKDSSSGRTPSFGTGVSEPLHFAFPTIREMNEVDDHETNNLAGEFAELRVADRNVVVVEVGTNGFWVTDLDDGSAAFNSLYVYSFSKPQGIVAGDRLLSLTGNTQEYLATTQVSFPIAEADPDRDLSIPDPVLITPSAACDDLLMEALESSLVRVEGARVPADFQAGSEDWTDYLEYGQWPIELEGGSCRIYADSSTVPGFDPTGAAGQELGEVTGLLREIWGKWIIAARRDADIGGGGFEDDRRPAPARGIRHAPARHRPGSAPLHPYTPRLPASSALEPR